MFVRFGDERRESLLVNQLDVKLAAILVLVNAVDIRCRQLQGVHRKLQHVQVRRYLDSWSEDQLRSVLSYTVRHFYSSGEDSAFSYAEKRVRNNSRGGLLFETGLILESVDGNTSCSYELTSETENHSTDGDCMVVDYA
uniref:(northern house mosquito) hypothetical protein n=1 Tax=Culex pipiens TaxID=7175 RepID=A0A8D8F950_CULPI